MEEEVALPRPTREEDGRNGGAADGWNDVAAESSPARQVLDLGGTISTIPKNDSATSGNRRVCERNASEPPIPSVPFSTSRSTDTDTSTATSGSAITVNNAYTPQQQQDHHNFHHRHRIGSADCFGASSSGTLRGDLALVEQKLHEPAVMRDPILDAVAAGAAARQAKLRQQQQYQQQQQRQKQTSQRPPATTKIRQAFQSARAASKNNNNNNNNDQIISNTSSSVAGNEWKLSLRRLAKVAASTAQTVAHVAAPVLTEARQVVVLSATEFAHDVQDEWKKQQDVQQQQELELDVQQQQQQQQQQEQQKVDDFLEAGAGKDDHDDDGDNPPLRLPESGDDGQEPSIDDTNGSIALPLSENAMVDASPVTTPRSSHHHHHHVRSGSTASAGSAQGRLEYFSSVVLPTLTDFAPMASPMSTPTKTTMTTNVDATRVSPLISCSEGDTSIPALSLPRIPFESSLGAVEEEKGMPPQRRPIMNAERAVDVNEEGADGEELNEVTETRATGTTNIVAMVSPEKNNDDGGVITVPSSKSVAEGPAVLSSGLVSDGFLDARSRSSDTEDAVDSTILELVANASAALDAATAEFSDPITPEDRMGKEGEAVGQSTVNADNKHQAIACDPVADGSISSSDPVEDGKAGGVLVMIDNAQAKVVKPEQSGSVETLAVYEEDVPVSFAKATQAVRNYHANVQTLEQCETDEQKETCRMICDDTYKLACKLVAEQSDVSGQHEGKYQVRLLDDLRRLRELQKTAFALTVVPDERLGQGDSEFGKDQVAPSGLERDQNVSTDDGVTTMQVSSDNDGAPPPAGKEAFTHGVYELPGSSAPPATVMEDIKSIEATELTGNEIYPGSKFESTAPAKVDAGATTPIREVVHTKTSLLFSSDDDAIYQPENDGSSLIGAEPPKPQDDHHGTEMESRNERLPKTGIPSFADRKSIVKFIVTNLTGYEVELKERDPMLELVDPSSFHDVSVPQSVFGRLGTTRSTSSLSSPPENDLVDEDIDTVGNQDVSRDEIRQVVSLFDLIPPKQDILKLSIASNQFEPVKPWLVAIGEKEEEVPPCITKQSSVLSLNESTGTMSNSAPSLSPRRKIKRTGRGWSNRNVFRSPRHTPQTPLSPLDTPVENRSIGGDDDPVDSTVSGSGVGLGSVVVGWNNEVEVNHLSVPDTEEMTDVMERPGLSHNLLAFSTLDDAHFLKSFSQPDEQSKDTRIVSSLLWRRLLANWKHLELWKAVSMRPCALPYSKFNEDPVFEEADHESVSKSTTSVHFQVKDRKIVFSSSVLPHLARSMLKDLFDHTPEDGLLGLTRYICEIGPTYASSLQSTSGGLQGCPPLCHDTSCMQRTVKPSLADSLKAIDIYNHAKQCLPSFKQLVGSIARYASLNDMQSTDIEASDITWSVGVKEHSAIEKKAARKYQGDILRVKDVLRGQIVFPDEGSMICGIYHLQKLSNKGSTSDNLLPNFHIVRLKNLFQTTGTGNEVCPQLPTGYRHILINIRLDSGFLAELQFQLVQFFDVMGEEGYFLHQEILSFEDAECSRGAMIGDSDGMDARSNFVRKVLSLPPDDGRVSPSPFDVFSTTDAACTADTGKKLEISPTTIHIGGGLAAAADAAAARNSANSNIDMGCPSSGNVIGLNGSSAPAAAKRNDGSTAAAATPTGIPFAGGGIAAATKKSIGEGAESNEAAKASPFGGGGIAAAAAAVAAKKAEKMRNVGDPLPNEPAKSNPLFGGGGIAAAAAAAAAKKAQKKRNGGDTVRDEPSKMSLFGAERKNKAVSTATEMLEPTGNSFLGSGIAAAAAAAAAVKNGSKTSVQSDDVTSSAKLEESTMRIANAFGHGGVATVTSATVAAMKRNASFEEEKKSEVPPVNGNERLRLQLEPNEHSKVISISQLVKEKPSTTNDAGQTNLTAKTSERAVNAPKKRKTYMWAEVFSTGVTEAISNPRDLPAFYCLYLLAMRMSEQNEAGSIESLSGDSKKPNVASTNDLSVLSKKLLLRSLAIANQAASLGMVGWLEYGSSNPLERTTSLPFEVFQQIACRMAAEKDWRRAADVLSALVLRCEQHLPKCHPTTLSSMLDLAGALMEAHYVSKATSVFCRVEDSIRTFLSHLETLFFDECYRTVLFERLIGQVVQFDDGTDAITVLRTFASGFERELCRDFLKHLGSNHPITLSNHSLAADAFSVVANCLRSGEGGGHENCLDQRDCIQEGSSYYFTLAFEHSKIAFTGWRKTKPLSHPNAASAVITLARCLRDLDKLPQSLKILETVASCLEKELDLVEQRSTKASGTQRAVNDEAKRAIANAARPPYFISRQSNRSRNVTRRQRRHPLFSLSANTTATHVCQREQTTVACLWMMAVLTVEQSPDERGRNRALSLLHTASLTMQRVLHCDELDDASRAVCLDLYRQVEEEARVLFAPLVEMSLPERPDDTESIVAHASPLKCVAPWDIVTPMRQRRMQSGRQAGAAMTNKKNIVNNATVRMI